MNCGVWRVAWMTEQGERYSSQKELTTILLYVLSTNSKGDPFLCVTIKILVSAEQ